MKGRDRLSKVGPVGGQVVTRSIVTAAGNSSAVTFRLTYPEMNLDGSQVGTRNSLRDTAQNFVRDAFERRASSAASTLGARSADQDDFVSNYGSGTSRVLNTGRSRPSSLKSVGV
jgi:hypothetical protein